MNHYCLSIVRLPVPKILKSFDLNKLNFKVNYLKNFTKLRRINSIQSKTIIIES